MAETLLRIGGQSGIFKYFFIFLFIYLFIFLEGGGGVKTPGSSRIVEEGRGEIRNEAKRDIDPKMFVCLFGWLVG